MKVPWKSLEWDEYCTLFLDALGHWNCRTFCNETFVKVAFLLAPMFVFRIILLWKRLKVRRLSADYAIALKNESSSNWRREDDRRAKLFSTPARFSNFILVLSQTILHWQTLIPSMKTECIEQFVSQVCFNCLWNIVERHLSAAVCLLRNIRHQVDVCLCWTDLLLPERKFDSNGGAL